MQQVRGTFLQYSQTLEKIAHLMMPDLQRLLDHESHVRTRRTCSDCSTTSHTYVRVPSLVCLPITSNKIIPHSSGYCLVPKKSRGDNSAIINILVHCKPIVPNISSSSSCNNMQYSVFIVWCEQLINQQVLANRRAYADLNARLLMADIEREKKLHTQWRRRLDDWRQLHTQQACHKFE